MSQIDFLLTLLTYYNCHIPMPTVALQH